MSGPRVLIVEDEFLIRLTLSEALAEEGFQVLEAADGRQALRQMEAHADLALVLTDVQLPGGMNGLEVVRRARVARPDLPVIYMTGRPDSTRDAVAGARDLFIPKPYLPSEVCAAARGLTGWDG